MDYHGGMVTRLNQADYIKTALRLPPEIHAKLHDAADDSGRSYNAEIVARLADSFYGPRELEDKLVVMQFVLHMATKHIADQEVVDSIDTLRKSLAKYKDGDELDQAGQKAFESLVNRSRDAEDTQKRPKKKPT